MTGDLSCPFCGVDVVQALTGRRRVFCSTKCRVAMHRWTKAFDAIQVGLDQVGRCYCCNRRGLMVGQVAGAPLCEGCAGTCDPDQGVMRPRPPIDSGSYYRRPSPCVTDWYWGAPPSGVGWKKGKPVARRRRAA